MGKRVSWLDEILVLGKGSFELYKREGGLKEIHLISKNVALFANLLRNIFWIYWPALQKKVVFRKASEIRSDNFTSPYKSLIEI